MKERLSRLLAACELLARDEAAALAGRNMTALTRAQQVKAAILADLEKEADSATPEARKSVRLEDRLKALLLLNKERSLHLANLKAATSERLRQIRTSANRLSTLRNVYGAGMGAGGEAFSAHG